MANLNYSVFLLKDGKDYLVYVPDLDLNTEGRSLDDAIYMAKDVIACHYLACEKCGEKLPKSTTYEEALKKTKKIKDIADFSKGIHTIVQVNINDYRKQISEKTVRRNVTIPEYLNEAANKAGINVSKILTNALTKQLKFA